MKNINSLLIVAMLITGTSASFAASHAAAPAASGASTVSALPIAQAEIRKIDLENKRITLKHGEIKNLNMPGMTMVFVVKDAKFLDDVKTGDKVSFTADHINGVFTVLSIKKSN